MSSLFSKTLQKIKKPLPIPLNTVFQISRRQVHFQDVLFGMENELNLERMIKLEKSGGPSIIMNAVAYDIQTSFITDQKSIQGNDDTTRVFGLNRVKIVPLNYSAFPMDVLDNVRNRNGLFEVSFQYDEKSGPWNPEKLLEYLSQNGVSALKNIASHSLFESFLKKRNATEEEIASMYAAVYRKNLPKLTNPVEIAHLKKPFEDNDPTKNLRPEKIKTLCEDVKKANENLPSFTDIEFGLFFLCLKPSEQYNLACVLRGGHLIKTEEIAAQLEELLELKKAKKTKKYIQKLNDFMVATKGNVGSTARSEMIINSFRELPLFDLIFQQNSDFMARNFEALCVKIDAYLLNLVKSGEKLVVNLQFPFVFDGAPAFIPLLVSVGEDNIIKVEELLADTTDPLSLAAKTVDPRLAYSIKTCGTPSANICILENPEEMEPKFIEASKALWKLVKNETSTAQNFVNRVNALYSIFSDPEVKLRFLNGKPLAISSKDENWNDICQAVDGIGFLTAKFRMKDKPPVMERVESYFHTMDEAIDDSYDRGAINAVENYDWQPIQTFELSEKFKAEKAKTLNELPSGFSEPIAYPEHIGAASPLNPLNETGQLLTEGSLKQLTRRD